MRTIARSLVFLVCLVGGCGDDGEDGASACETGCQLTIEADCDNGPASESAWGLAWGRSSDSQILEDLLLHIVVVGHTAAVTPGPFDADHGSLALVLEARLHDAGGDAGGTAGGIEDQGSRRG